MSLSARDPGARTASPADTAGWIVGREAALAGVARFLDGADRPRGLVLEGGTGIGKTTIFDEACRAASGRGAIVLVCRPVQAEVTLAFGGLVDLFEALPPRALGQVPRNQRIALEIAIRRRAPSDAAADLLTVAAAARAAISILADTRPVVVAVDDAQWLDASTDDVLAYVFRRLTVERVGVLVARRPEEDGGRPAPLGLEPATLPTEVVTLEPLSLSSLHHVIRARTGLVLPRPLLHRVAAASAGNPFFAIGLATSMAEGGRLPALGEALPAPASLLDLVARRLATIAPAHRDILRVVASLSPATSALVERVAGRDPEPALEAARAAGVLDPRPDVLRFAHPLFAECIVRLSAPGARRSVHARIAASVDEPEARARHLALAVEPPDEQVARALDVGADAARSRGGLRSAAELLDLARRFTPASDRASAHRRAFSAAELTILAGDRPAARELLRGLVESAEVPLWHRAAALYAEILVNDGASDEADRLLRRARETVTEPAAMVRIDLDLAYGALLRLRPEEAAEHTASALPAARAAEDAPLLAEALAYDGLARLLAGRDPDEAALAEALRLDDPDRPPYMGLPTSGVVGLVRAFEGRHEEARTLFGDAGDKLDALGDDCDLAHVLLWSSWLELRAGRLEAAAALARQAATMGETTGSELLRAWAVAQAALVEATRGRPAAAQELLTEASPVSGTSRGVVALWLGVAAGTAAMAGGRMDMAATAFRPLLEGVAAGPLPDPVLAYFLPDAVEALCSTDPGGDDLVLARRSVDVFEGAATKRRRAWAIAGSHRGRGAIAAGEGRLDASADHLRRALQLHTEADMPVGRARTLLSLGRVERRRGERRAARAALVESAEALDGLGCDGWAAVAHAEIARLPGRRSTGDQLTVGERRVAELSGAGRTNREVAATLFLSPKTVEANLARVYRKLGISTRAELGAWLSAGGGTTAQTEDPGT